MLVERGVREVSETRRRHGPRSAHSPARGSVSGGRGADSTDIARDIVRTSDIAWDIVRDSSDIARDTEMELGDGDACQARGENQTAEGEENVGGRKGPYTIHKIPNSVIFGSVRFKVWEIYRPRNCLDLNHMDPHRPKLVVGISSEGQSHNQLLVTAGKLNFGLSPQLNLVNYKSARSSVKIKTKTENGRLYRANPRGLECCAEYYYHHRLLQPRTHNCP